MFVKVHIYIALKKLFDVISYSLDSFLSKRTLRADAHGNNF